MRPVWLDGKIVPFEQATVSALSHSMQRGSLVFDAGTFHRTFSGTAVFRLREHVVRFQRSASIIGHALAFDTEAIEAGTRAIVRASGLAEGYLRWEAYFPSMEADLVPHDPRASVAIVAYAAGDRPARPRPPTFKVRVPDDVRKAGPDVIPANAKVAAGYLGPMLARRRALAEGYDEVVLLDRDGLLAEAPTANVFVVKGGAVITPPLGKVLDGITRDSVLTLARDEGITAREEPLSLDALLAADEAFLTSSSLPLAPVAHVNGRAIGSGDIGPITRRLRDRLGAIQRGEDPRYSRWLAPV